MSDWYEKCKPDNDNKFSKFQSCFFLHDIMISLMTEFCRHTSCQLILQNELPSNGNWNHTYWDIHFISQVICTKLPYLHPEPTSLNLKTLFPLLFSLQSCLHTSHPKIQRHHASSSHPLVTSSHWASSALSDHLPTTPTIFSLLIILYHCWDGFVLVAPPLCSSSFFCPPPTPSKPLLPTQSSLRPLPALLFHYLLVRF